MTLLVTPDQANKLDLGQNKGSLHLSLRNPEDKEAADTRPATLADLRFRQEKPWDERPRACRSPAGDGHRSARSRAAPGRAPAPAPAPGRSDPAPGARGRCDPDSRGAAVRAWPSASGSEPRRGRRDRGLNVERSYGQAATASDRGIRDAGFHHQRPRTDRAPGSARSCSRRGWTARPRTSSRSTWRRNAWRRARPDLLVVVLPPDPERALAALATLPVQAPARVLVVGPASDPKLVLRALRGGADDYVDEARARGRAQAPPSAALPGRAWPRRRSRGGLIAVLAPSGGSGSSTLAANVATVLAKEHKEVACWWT